MAVFGKYLVKTSEDALIPFCSWRCCLRMQAAGWQWGSEDVFHTIKSKEEVKMLFAP